MVQRLPMTARGLEKLQNELSHLKTVERPQVIKSIAEARKHGDLSENAEYHAAKDKQGFVEGRISEIESSIFQAEVIDLSKLSGPQVCFGATVTLYDEDTEEELTYQIVGKDESDISNGLLSIESPIARALIGKLEGEVAEVKAPGGDKSYEIMKVVYI